MSYKTSLLSVMQLRLNAQKTVFGVEQTENGLKKYHKERSKKFLTDNGVCQFDYLFVYKYDPGVCIFFV